MVDRQSTIQVFVAVMALAAAGGQPFRRCDHKSLPAERQPSAVATSWFRASISGFGQLGTERRERDEDGCVGSFSAAANLH